MRKEVPWKAVSIRKMKYEARFGANAVPMLKMVKRIAVATQILVLQHVLALPTVRLA